MASTLRPNQISDVLRKLRDAALAEADKDEPNVFEVSTSNFDVKRQPVQGKPFNPDAPRDTNEYRGENCPHVGNGAGPAWR